MEERFFTRREAADFLGLHINSIDNLVRRGKLPRYRREIGVTTWFYKQADLEELKKFKKAA